MPQAPGWDEDKIERHALEIIKAYLIEGRTLEQVSHQFDNVPVSSMHRRIRKWLKEGRFEIVETTRKSRASVGHPDNEAEDALLGKTKLRDAKVVDISGVDAAYSDDYLLESDSDAVKAAYQAHDELHQALGQVAARYFLDRVKADTPATIGLTSGRAVGFTVMELDVLGRMMPRRFARYGQVKLVATCGGARIGPWLIETGRSLDADENVYHLAEVLQVPETNIYYVGDWASGGQKGAVGSTDPSEKVPEIDLMIAGLGQVSGRYPFLSLGHFRAAKRDNRECVAGAFKVIQDLQRQDTSLINSVADISLRFFLVGDRGYPKELQDAVSQINHGIHALEFDRIRGAKEVILVAGGAQKVETLAQLVSGRTTEGVPIDISRTTLITDSRTAWEVLDRIN